MKVDFTFVMLVKLKFAINLKVNKGLDRFIKKSNWYLQRVLGDS